MVGPTVSQNIKWAVWLDDLITVYCTKYVNSTCI